MKLRISMTTYLRELFKLSISSISIPEHKYWIKIVILIGVQLRTAYKITGENMSYHP